MSRTIKEAEELTKVTSQNIRYYEKQGLLAPKRDKENSYRLYSEEEISRLKLIRLFRKLGMPIGEIRRMFEGDISLEDQPPAVPEGGIDGSPGILRKDKGKSACRCRPRSLSGRNGTGGKAGIGIYGFRQ